VSLKDLYYPYSIPFAMRQSQLSNGASVSFHYIPRSIKTSSTITSPMRANKARVGTMVFAEAPVKVGGGALEVELGAVPFPATSAKLAQVILVVFA
jgi:hypothetical protein